MGLFVNCPLFAKEAKCLIACPIFKDELELALPSDADLSIHYMDYRIHNDGKRMLQELKTTIISEDCSEISLLVLI